MPKYFFHFRQGRHVTADETGIDFQDAEGAYLGAYDAAVGMWTELLRDRRDPRACAFQVDDDAGRTMFVLPFREVLESCRSEGAGHVAHAARAFYGVLSARHDMVHSFREFRREIDIAKTALQEAKALIAATNALETMMLADLSRTPVAREQANAGAAAGGAAARPPG